MAYVNRFLGNNKTYKCDNATIVGNSNEVRGNNNTVQGNSNVVRGNNNKITGNSNEVRGNSNEIGGNSNEVRGNDNTVIGNSNAVRGSDNIVNGKDNRVVGDDNNIYGEDNTSRGNNTFRTASGFISRNSMNITLSGINQFGGVHHTSGSMNFGSTWNREIDEAMAHVEQVSAWADEIAQEVSESRPRVIHSEPVQPRSASTWNASLAEYQSSLRLTGYPNQQNITNANGGTRGAMIRTMNNLSNGRPSQPESNQPLKEVKVEDEETKVDKLQCKICFVNEFKYKLNCGHVHCCVCTNGIIKLALEDSSKKKCPQCRAQITSIEKLHF